MKTTNVWLTIGDQSIVRALEEAARKLDDGERQVILDFESVRKIDSSALRAIDELASIADKKGIKVVLRGVHVDLYKVLKLVKVASRFSFVESCHAESSTE